MKTKGWGSLVVNVHEKNICSVRMYCQGGHIRFQNAQMSLSVGCKKGPWMPKTKPEKEDHFCKENNRTTYIEMKTKG